MRGLVVNGQWTEDPKEIKKVVEGYFEKILKEQGVNRPVFRSSLFQRLSDQEAAGLEVPFSEVEVWTAIKNCGSSKAPGPDGFNFRFLKKFWPLLKQDILLALEWFWENGKINDGCNSSFISLIPKVTCLLNLNEYRRISLIGSYYKIVSKVLTARLQKVIGSVIGEEQHAFIHGRWVLIANELLSFVTKDKTKSFAFKVDYEKTYDCVCWEFLFDTMRSMGFGEKCIRWIRACLESSKISILVNGSPTGEFKVSKGLRQGDPISPFLFVIVAEALNVAMKELIGKGKFEGLEVGKRVKVLISHLQYADDTLFFEVGNPENLARLIKTLRCFEWAAGLKINFNKSKLIGLGVSDDVSRGWASSIGCGSTFQVLGLPIGSRMSFIESWNGVAEKFSSKLTKWKAKTLSSGGRLTLVRSYSFVFVFLFHAPKGVLNFLERVRREFFWGGGMGEKRVINWVNWENTLNTFGKGGLLIGSLAAFSESGGGDSLKKTNPYGFKLSKDYTARTEGLKVKERQPSEAAGKTVDRLGVNFSSLVGKKLGNGFGGRGTEKYGKRRENLKIRKHQSRDHFASASVSRREPAAWRSRNGLRSFPFKYWPPPSVEICVNKQLSPLVLVERERELLCRYAAEFDSRSSVVVLSRLKLVSLFIYDNYRISDSTRFWLDRWLGPFRLCDEFTWLFQLEINKEATVKERCSWVGYQWMWKWNWRRGTRGREAGELLSLIDKLGELKPRVEEKDTAFWWLDINGEFSVKGLRRLVDEKLLQENLNFLETSWIKEVPKKVSIFVWKLRQKKLPVRAVLDQLGMDLHSLLCPRCEGEVETIDHAFVFCEEGLWKEVFKWWRCGEVTVNSIDDLLSFQDDTWSSERVKLKWKAMLWSFLYLLWRNRNKVVFEKGVKKIALVFGDFQQQSFSWIHNRTKQGMGSGADWLSHPHLG
ncbi:LOW QUALITY PROTEIN: hypothetical protein OSB04_031363 [Centaurea solstitialis]|uniref:Reverse transcriptase domain-containing protein n=1 Tax=Centaurea solstitialis TaxID=347529 RepID=A0AA38SM09_9ASTR|nr:LOW QUALITY PROTEIN: hypothetical protein OSB04_031363 [Centaurea solstitialis]